MGDLSPDGSQTDADVWMSDNATDEELSVKALFEDYPEGLPQFASVCCIVFMLVGIPGNLITIVALARCKKVRNATAVFIMNLSCSDLLFCCFNLPLAASTFWRRAWVHGPLLCQLFPLARYVLVAVSLFTVLAITINRYVTISHPRLYPTLYRRRNLAVMVVCTWLGALGALAATWFGVWGKFGLDTEIGSCSILPDRYGRSPKEFLFVVAFVLPCFAIAGCYARIFFIVRNSARKSRAPIKRSRGVLEDSAVGSASTAIERSPGPENGSAHVCSEKGSVPKRTFLAPPQLHCPPTPLPERSSSSGVDTLDGHDYGGSETPIPGVGETAKRLRQAAAVLRRSPAPTRPPRLTAKDRKLLNMIMAIMISFWVCYLPITITKIFKELRMQPFMNIAGYLLIYLTTCINPIIYVVMSSEYRQAYKNLLMCRRRA